MSPNIFLSLYENRIDDAVKKTKESLSFDDDYCTTLRLTVLNEASIIFSERIDEMTRKRFGEAPNQESIDYEESELKRTVRRVLAKENLEQFSDLEIHNAFNKDGI